MNQSHTTVRYHQVGACTVTATWLATDDYIGATADQTVTIMGELSVTRSWTRTRRSVLSSATTMSW